MLCRYLLLLKATLEQKKLPWPEAGAGTRTLVMHDPTPERHTLQTERSLHSQLEAQAVADADAQHFQQPLVCDCLHNQDAKEPDHGGPAVYDFRVFHKAKL